MCGYLEDYVEVTAKVQKSQAKDYEKVLKVSLGILDFSMREGIGVCHANQLGE